MTAALGESGGPIARRLRERAERAQDSRHDHDLAPGEAGEVPRVAPGVVCVVSGHTAMVSFADLPGPGVAGGDRAALARPAARPGRPRRRRLPAGALRGVRAGGARPRRGCTGWRRASSSARTRCCPTARTPPALVARVSSFPHCADVVINSRYDPDTDEASAFEPHVGSHGGLGGPQQFGFLAYPRALDAARRDRRRRAAAPRAAGLADRPRPPRAHR